MPDREAASLPDPLLGRVHTSRRTATAPAAATAESGAHNHHRHKGLERSRQRTDNAHTDCTDPDADGHSGPQGSDT